MVRATGSGDVSSRRTCPRTSPSTSLAAIEGRGLALELGDGPPVALGDVPFAFPGDVPCRAELRDRPIVDLNVMIRRGAGAPRCAGPRRPDRVAGARHHLVFGAHGPLAGAAAWEPFALAPRDTLVLGPDESARLALAGRWLYIQLVPLPQGPPQ
jgi:environmental stress-induced protein Ves